MKVKLICLCSKEWEVDLDEFLDKVKVQWNWWIERGLVSVETQNKIKKQHNREELINEFKEKGYLQCLCEECQRRTTQMLVDGEDFKKDVAFTGKIR